MSTTPWSWQQDLCQIVCTLSAYQITCWQTAYFLCNHKYLEHQILGTKKGVGIKIASLVLYFALEQVNDDYNMDSCATALECDTPIL